MQAVSHIAISPAAPSWVSERMSMSKKDELQTLHACILEIFTYAFFLEEKEIEFYLFNSASVSAPLGPQASSSYKKVWHHSAHLLAELLGGEGLVVQSQFSLQNEFKTSLGYKVRESVLINQLINH